MDNKQPDHGPAETGWLAFTREVAKGDASDIVISMESGEIIATIRLMGIRGSKTARIACHAPSHIHVDRREVYVKKQQQASSHEGA